MNGTALRRSEERGRGGNDWLESRFSFSFADYHDPDHMGFGPLRVINEDWVKPASGFGTHPHRDMEIVTVVLAGTVEHRDSTGGRGLIRAGEVQAMTAGTGLTHSERNPSPDETLHLLQIWLLPDRRGLSPGYRQRRFFEPDPTGSGGLEPGRFLPVASGRGEPGALPIHQDATLFLLHLDAGHSVAHGMDARRRAYVHVIDGEGVVSGERLRTGDAVKLTAPESVPIEAARRTRLLFFDLP